jgi:hypothetical protein
VQQNFGTTTLCSELDTGAVQKAAKILMALHKLQKIKMLHGSTSGNAGAQRVGVRKCVLALVAQPEQFGDGTSYCSFD